MTVTVNVEPGLDSPTHDVSLAYGSDKIGLIFTEQSTILQEIPISDPARPYSHKMASWIGGRGRQKYSDDPTGFYDSANLWTFTDGKLFPSPLAQIMPGYRADMEFAQPGSVSWQTLLTTQKYISRSFVAVDSSNRSVIGLWLDVYGSPANLTIALYSNNAGSPNTALQSTTLAAASMNQYGPTFVAITPQAVTSGTTYHIVVYSGADTTSNYWRVATDSTGSSSKISANGTVWSAPNPTFSMYYFIRGADIKRQWRFFSFASADYVISQNDDLSAPLLYIIGDRGKATSATSTSLSDTKGGCSSWSADALIGEKIKIINGTGDGQVRSVTDNDATSQTVAAFDKTPDSTSEYVNYDSVRLVPLTGHGLTSITGKPVSTGGVVYFPQGGAVKIGRMHIDYTKDNNHDFAIESATNYAEFMGTGYDPALGNQIWWANADLSIIYYSPFKAWGADLASVVAAGNQVGTSDTRITNILCREATYIWKEDSIWKVINGMPTMLNSSLNSWPSPNNGKAVCASDGELWWGWANSIVRAIGTQGLSAQDMLNYRGGTVGIPADRTGYPSDAVKVGGWTFFAYDGGSSNRSSIIAHNGKNWAELYRSNVGHRIRNLYWQNNPDGRPRLWFDVNGDLWYIPFPLNAVNPLQDTGLPCNYFAELISSTFDGDESNLYKMVHALRMVMENLGTTGEIRAYYQTNNNVGTDTWTSVGTTAANENYHEFTMDVGEVTQYRIRLRFYTSSSTKPPTLNSYETTGTIFSPLKYQWISVFKVDCNNPLTKNSDPDFDPDTLVTWLSTAHANAYKLTMRSVNTHMDGGTGRVVVISAPAIQVNHESTLDGKTLWDGTISIAIREAQ